MRSYLRLSHKYSGTNFFEFLIASPLQVILGIAVNCCRASINAGQIFSLPRIRQLLFGEPLSPTTAAALRLVVPHLYACPSAKGINGLEFTETAELGFWERNGYHERGKPWAQEPGGGLF